MAFLTNNLPNFEFVSYYQCEMLPTNSHFVSDQRTNSASHFRFGQESQVEFQHRVKNWDF